MRSSFRPLRSRFTRLLACVLVTVSLLANGMAFAQPAAAKKPCCAQMMAKSMHGGGCEEGGKPCPSPAMDCDDQCLFRCQANTALPLIVLAVPPTMHRQVHVLMPTSGGHRLAPSAPELRPPISA